MKKADLKKIIMATGSTEKEAEKHIRNGAHAYTVAEKPAFLKNCEAAFMEEAEALAAWEKLDRVCVDGFLYFVDFVL